MADCSHVFRDGNKCVKCGTGVARLLLNERAEWALVTRQLRADLARVKDQCNRQEHGFARRESELQGDLARVMKDGHAISTENGRLERELNAARAETERLRERVAEARRITAQLKDSFDEWPDNTSENDLLALDMDRILQALTSDPEPTT